MNTADLKVWKDIYTQLQTDIQDNDSLIREISDQIAAQQERNKQEVQKMAEKASLQQKDLEALLSQVESDDLFALPGDQEAREAFAASLRARIEQSRQVVEFAQSLLDSSPASKETLDKISQVKEQDVAAKDFSARSLLGNWIHYFQKDMFTCQSFWDDNEFKEYDFRGNRLIEERSGQYSVKDGKVTLTYSNGDSAVYTVTGYSDDCLDYLISSTPIRFDYMPEDLLNSLLEEAPHA